MKGTPWQDRLILVAGIWLLASPFVVGTAELSHPATVAALVAAAMLVSSAAEAPIVPDVVEEWIDLTVAVSLAASPWLLGYTDHQESTVNAVVTGAVVAVLALVGLVRARLGHPEAANDAYPTP